MAGNHDKGHALDCSDDHTPTSDREDCDCTTEKHGLMPKAAKIKLDTIEAGARVGNCSIATGTYTGDGAVSQAISGLGFAPKYLHIYLHPTGEGNTSIYVKLDQSWGDYMLGHSYWATHEHYDFDNRIKSLDPDGFTVDDDGIDQHPNKNGQVYDYVAIG